MTRRHLVRGRIGGALLALALGAAALPGGPADARAEQNGQDGQGEQVEEDEGPLTLALYSVDSLTAEPPAEGTSLDERPDADLAPQVRWAWMRVSQPALVPAPPFRAISAALGGGAIIFDPRAELVEPFLELWTRAEGRGSVELLRGAVLARVSAADHARIAAILEAATAAIARRVALEARIVAVPSSDPALRSAAPGALLEAALGRGRPLLHEAREVVRGGRARLARTSCTTAVFGRWPGEPGRDPSKDAYVEPLRSGAEAVLEPRILPDGSAVRLSIVAADVALERLGRARALGADVDLPALGERSARALLEVPDGGRAAIALGPRGASETAVLVVGARIVAGPCGAGVVTAIPSRGHLGTTRRFHDDEVVPIGMVDAQAALAVEHVGDDGETYTTPPDVLLDVVKSSTPKGAWEGWREATACRGVLLLGNEPAVISASARIVAGLAAQGRPRALDAWVLRAPAAPPATGAITEAQAAALLAGGLRVEARMGGGLPTGGATHARACLVERFLGSLTGATATAAPLPCEAESGLALEAHLDADGAALTLRARLTEQAADLSRTARLEGVEVHLPVLARREVAGTASVPAGGGWALFASGGEDALLLLVRVGS